MGQALFTSSSFHLLEILNKNIRRCKPVTIKPVTVCSKDNRLRTERPVFRKENQGRRKETVKRKKGGGGGKENSLMKGRATHSVMKRALQSFFQNCPHSHTRHFKTHTND